MKHFQDIEWVKQAVASLDVPRHLQQRIFDFYNYTQLHYDQEAYDVLFKGLSPTLNLELKLYLYADLLRSSVFFNGVKVQVIKSMVGRGGTASSRLQQKPRSLLPEPDSC